MPTTAATSSHKVWVIQPTPATSMMAISSILTKRARRDFSTLSAIWPAVAENTTYGRMNSAGITMLSVAGLIDVQFSASKVSMTSSAVLNRLSLKAPKNWVQKNGANRRSVRRVNWLDWLMWAGRLEGELVKYSTSAATTNNVSSSHDGAPIATVGSVWRYLAGLS